MEGKAVIVTGSGSRGRAALGIGYATAVLFARQGARVVVADLDEERAEVTVKFIRENGGEASFVSADITGKRIAGNWPRRVSVGTVAWIFW